MKVCTKCGLAKDVEKDFHRQGDRKMSQCKVCVRARVKAYQESPEGRAKREAYINSEKSREWRKAYHASPKEKARRKAYQASEIWKQSRKAYNKTERGARVRLNVRLKCDYDITLEEYERRLLDQGGCCKICGSDDPGPTPRFHVDHCHATNKIRGLLCFNCNSGLGQFKDNVLFLRRALEYLETS